MTVLDLVSVLGLVGMFVIMSSALVAALGAAASLPRRVLRFLGISAAGDGVAPEHLRWLAVVVFAGFTLAVLAAELKDLLTSTDTTRVFLAWFALVLEAGWIVYLGNRIRNTRYSGERRKLRP